MIRKNQNHTVDVAHEKTQVKQPSSTMNMEDTEEGDTTSCNPTTFKPGDHVTLSCNAAGIPYQHHAIVLSVGQESNGESTLCVSDFTADGADGIVASSGTALTSFGTAAITNDSDGASDKNAEGGVSKKQNNTNNQHGLRVLTVSANEWQKVQYNDSAPTSPPNIVRQRVEYLLKHPHTIPSYSLVESNCECVAVWCKTGKWTTLQAEHWLGTTNFGSRVAIAGLSIASAAVPGAGLLLAAGVATEIVTGLWGAHAKRKWEEQTTLLNDAFDKSRIVLGRREGPESTSDTTTSANSASVLGNPFSDTRSLRGMVDAYQRADAILAMVDMDCVEQFAEVQGTCS